MLKAFVCRGVNPYRLVITHIVFDDLVLCTQLWIDIGIIVFNGIDISFRVLDLRLAVKIMLWPQIPLLPVALGIGHLDFGLVDVGCAFPVLGAHQLIVAIRPQQQFPGLRNIHQRVLVRRDIVIRR